MFNNLSGLSGSTLLLKLKGRHNSDRQAENLTEKVNHFDE